MALITCPECGKQISDYATVCIHCGIPMEIIKKLLAEKESPVDPIPGKDESSEATVQQQLTHAENSAEEQIENRIISCIICGTKYEAVDRHCPICKYPAFALSASIDMEPLRDLMVQYGKATEVDLNQPLLTRVYTYDELEKLGKTVSVFGKTALVSDYKKYADQGNIYAKANLGMLYFKGCGVRYEEKTALELLKKPAEKGIAEAQFIYGCILKDIYGHKTEGVDWIRKAAEQGYADAQNNLGALYLNGKGVILSKVNAVEWFRKAAAQGNKAAADRLVELGGAEKQYQLGKKYYFGKGVEENYTKAVECFLNAADQGHADAQYFLGKMYERGEGVEQDYRKAEDWYLKAADQGKTGAWLDLGLLYEYKIKDYTKAAEWYSKAAAQGDKEAADRLAELNKVKGLLERLNSLI